MSSSRERSTLTGTRSGGRLRHHPRFLQYVDQLAAEGAYVLLYLVHVVLGDALVLRLALLHRHVAAHQVTHYALVAEVPFRGLFYLTLWWIIDEWDYQGLNGCLAFEIFDC